MKLKPGARAVLDGILTLPLVLPPTVAGFFLLLIFSLKRPFGSFLLDNFDIKIVQTWKGCVVAAAVIAFPLMYRNARAAFEQVDINLIHAGQTLGMSDSPDLLAGSHAGGRTRGSHPEQCWHLHARSENMAQPLCLPEISLEKPEQFLLPLHQRQQPEITELQASGSL